MSSHRDAEVAEVIVVLTHACRDQLDQHVQLLGGAGLEINETDPDSLTIMGTIDAAKLPTLQQMDCVNYVRVAMTYIADYPPGDPRDRDNDDALDEDSENDDD